MDNTIVNSEAARIAHEIAGYSHKPVEEVVLAAVRELAARTLPKETSGARSQTSLTERVQAIQERVAQLPILDRRTPEEIIGYDEYGLPPQ